MDISKPFLLCVNTSRPSNSATGKWTFQNPSYYVETPQGCQTRPQASEHFKTLLIMWKHTKAVKLSHKQVDISKLFLLCVNTPRLSNSATGKWTFQNPSSYVSTPQGRQTRPQASGHFKTLIIMCKHPKAVKLGHKQVDISKPLLLCVNTQRPSNSATSKWTFQNSSYYV